MAQSSDFSECTAYTIMYLALVIYTCMFTFTYFKRFLYMAFFTMIAPLVALTYPVDKLKDGKAQAFDLWFKEYTMNAIIQPIHLLLYTVFVGSAMDLAISNPIYAIVAIGFLTPAEKFIKKMFGVDSQTTSGGLGEVAGGALAYSGVKQLAGQLMGKKGKQPEKGLDSGVGNNALTKRGADKSFKTNPLDIIAGGPNPVDLEEKRDKPKDKEGKDKVDLHGEDAKEKENKEEQIEDIIKREKSEWKEKEIDLGDEHWNNRRTELIKEREEKNKKEEEEQRKKKQQEEEKKRRQEEQGHKLIFGSDVIEPEANPSGRLGKIKNSRMYKGLGSVGSTGVRKLKRATVDKVTTKEGRRKIYKSGIRGIAKVGGMAAGATLLGTAAAAAGVATGDLSKGISTAVGGLTLGASVGGSIGTKYGQKTVSSIENVAQTYREGAYTKDEIKAEKQKAFDREWKNKEENYKYLRSEGLSSQEAKTFLTSNRTQKFLDAGLTDIKTIYKASELKDAENKRYSDEHAIARAKLASGLSNEFGRSEQNAFRESITKENKNITNDMATNLINDIKKIKGVD